MGVGYIRLPWMDPFREPFEVKAFVLEQLAKTHEAMCDLDIHAPGPPKDGKLSTTECPHCDYTGSSL